MAASGNRPESECLVELTSKCDQDDIERDGSYESSENDRISQNTIVDGDNVTEENEDDHLLEKEQSQNGPQASQPKVGMCSAVVWMVVNTLATIGIV